MTYRPQAEPTVGTAEAAEVLGCHRETVKRLIGRGELAATRRPSEWEQTGPGEWLIKRTDLDAFAKAYRPARGRPRSNK